MSVVAAHAPSGLHPALPAAAWEVSASVCAQVPPSPQLPRGASALRVSRAVRSNLQADAGGATEYKGATAGAGTGDVQLHTPDAEVDFDERGSDAGGPCHCFCIAGPRQRCLQQIDADSAHNSMGKRAMYFLRRNTAKGNAQSTQSCPA